MKAPGERARIERAHNPPPTGDAMREAELMRMLGEARALVLSLEIRLGLRGPDNEPIHPIVRWRQERGLSQSELAAQVGISAPGLNRIEHLPGFAGRDDTRKRIAETLEVPEEYLRAPMDLGRARALRSLGKLIAADVGNASSILRAPAQPDGQAGTSSTKSARQANRNRP